MAKKIRLKADAFDWVQDTSKTADREKTAEQPSRSRKARTVTKAAAKRQEKATVKKTANKTEKAPSPPMTAAGAKKEARPRPSLVKAKSERILYVKFKKRSGEIVAMQEFFLDREPGMPWTSVPEDQDTAEILLAGEQAKMKLIDIHENYKVTKSGKTAKLVRKT